MKAVLISIKPQWAELIANGKKTVEVRKTKPKLDVPFKCYIYCTQNNGYMYRTRLDENRVGVAEVWNGKVIGEFVCDRIYHIKNLDTRFLIDNDERLTNSIANASCLYFEDMKNYFGNKDGYAWHITELVIYDNPKALSEFKHECDGNCLDTKTKKKCDKLSNSLSVSVDRFECDRLLPFKRPPQSWAYCEGV